MQATNGSVVSFGSRGRLIGCCMALALALSALVFAPAAANAEAAPTTTYLALGDSISFGYTQEKFNIHYPNESPSYFEEGFTNYFTSDLKKATEVGKTIRLVNDACPGETSNGLIGENEEIGGKGSTESIEEVEQKKEEKLNRWYGGYQGLGDYHPCKYHFVNGLPLHNSLATTAQLEEAVSILTKNNPYTGKPNVVKAITLNIGSNDELAGITQCKDEVFYEYATKGQSESEWEGKKGKVFSPAESSGAGITCLQWSAIHVTIPHILGNIGTIITVLEKAGYKGPIVVLGFYNPDSEVLPSSDLLQEALNYYLETSVVAPFNAGYHNVTFANPFPVFNKGAGIPEEEFKKEGGTNGKQEQASICKYTEMCNPNVQTGEPPTGKNGDIHPTVMGYKALAKLVNEAYLANESK